MGNLPLFDLDTDKTIHVTGIPYKRIRAQYLDFKDVPASSGIYGIHPYPAMFHFLVVRELIEKYSFEGDLVLDPFMGSGVVAGECLVGGRNFVGYDINPLAILVAQVRTTPIEHETLVKALTEICEAFRLEKPEEVRFHNIDYWFDESIVQQLSRLRKAIERVKDGCVQRFFKVAFSETVRRVSRTDYNEFKLLRRKESRGVSDVLKVFQDVSYKNIRLITGFYTQHTPKMVKLHFEERNIAHDLALEDGSVDLVVTSPPYGDSRTTVAYGQFSRLSLRWLGLEERVDRESLGAKPKDITQGLPSALLYQVIEDIANKDKKRAREVFGFYSDLYRAICFIAKKVKKDGTVCFVVGNRRVKGLELPTDRICADFFEDQGFEHEKTLVRAISSKRMPLENAPSNVKGEKDVTMHNEYIVLLKKVTVPSLLT
jgi:DNA modification methylase